MDGRKNPKLDDNEDLFANAKEEDLVENVRPVITPELTAYKRQLRQDTAKRKEDAKEKNQEEILPSKKSDLNAAYNKCLDTIKFSEPEKILQALSTWTKIAINYQNSKSIDRGLFGSIKNSFDQQALAVRKDLTKMLTDSLKSDRLDHKTPFLKDKLLEIKNNYVNTKILGTIYMQASTIVTELEKLDVKLDAKPEVVHRHKL